MTNDLTPLQRKIARLVHKGDQIPAIARQLHPLTPRQVRRHIEAISLKLPDYPGTARQRITLWQMSQSR